ncbi:MAG: DUF177 domain-containing protein [Rhodobacteraceae bacterium]|nr:DUF177 domain-containing protein [Paracoccaceae bacterium]
MWFAPFVSSRAPLYPIIESAARMQERIACPMAPTDTSTPVLRIADLNERRPTRFELMFDAAQIRQFAEELDLISLKKLRFKGEVTAKGRDQWELTADLGVTVQQNCVISFVPVTTRIDEKITRRYVPETIFEQVAEDEEIAEASGDDAMDILPSEIHLLDVFLETLVLALPDYPRAEGVELGERVFSEDGIKPMRDADAKPFAGLAALKEKMEKGD